MSVRLSVRAPAAAVGDASAVRTGGRSVAVGAVKSPHAAAVGASGSATGTPLRLVADGWGCLQAGFRRYGDAGDRPGCPIKGSADVGLFRANLWGWCDWWDPSLLE